MRITPSATYLALANGAAKQTRFRVYARKTASLSEPLSSGTAWTEISDRVKEVPDIASRIEYELGQFTSDKIRLSAFDIAWMKNAFLQTNVRTPNSIAGLKLWLAADKIQDLVDGNTVTTWLDASGSGYNVTQSSASLKPLYKTNILNGKPVVRFDGSNDYMQGTDVLEFLDKASFTVVAFFNPSIVDATYRRIISKQKLAAPTEGWLMWYQNSPSTRLARYQAASSNLTPDAGLLTVGTSYAMVATYNGATLRMYLNGTEKGSGASSTLSIQDTSTFLTVGAADTGGSVFAGDIAELMIYNREITAAERAGLDYYAASKYGVSVTGALSDDPVELKIEADLIGAADIVPAFAGWIDKAGAESEERSNAVSFSVYTADDLGYRLPAENVSTQFINDDIDGSGTDGLVLQGIPGLYIKDANLSGYTLLTGTHVITYQVNGGSKQAKLDDGAFVTLASNNTAYTLYNLDSTQAVQVWVKLTADLSGTTTAITDDIIVVSEGKTLPNQWYRNVQASYLLPQLYSQIGISTVTLDSQMEVDTYDGADRAFFYDIPPNDVGVTGTKYALENNGTDLFIGVGNIIYKRTVATGTYTKLATITAGTIVRFWYNARNNHLWIFYTNGTTDCIRKLTLATNTLSAEVVINGSASYRLERNSMELIDYNYTGSSYKYGIIYTDTYYPDVRFLDAGPMTISLLSSSAGSIITNKFLFLKNASTIWYKVTGPSSTWEYWEFTINGSGAFVDGGAKLTAIADDYGYIARYNPVDDRIVYSPTSGTVKSHTTASATTTSHVTGIGAMNWMIYGNSRVYFTTGSNFAYYVSGTAAAVLMTTNATGIQVTETALTYLGRLYGISHTGGVLFHVDKKIPFLVRVADFEGTSVSDAIRKVLISFNLVHTLSAAKKAFVYRRCDGNGTPQTTGNTLSVTITQASDIEEISLHSPKYDIIEVVNATKTVTYNGAKFNANVLSTSRKLTIQSELILDEMIKDLAYYAWQFFKVDRSLYRLNLGGVPLFQYEPFDNCSVVLSTTKIVRTGSGPIYAQILRQNSSMAVEVLL